MTMKPSMQEQEILKHVKQLTLYEQSEIWRYFASGIYYLGKLSKKFKFDEVKHFHDERGYFRIKRRDHIIYRYEIVQYLGEGTYSEVFKALDHKTCNRVAIKVMKYSAKKKEVFEKKFFDEILIYEYLSLTYTERKPELSQMLNYFKFREHLCIVMKLCKQDLRLKLRTKYTKGFNMERVKVMVRSILKALKSLHDCNIVHGDVKPENIAFLKNQSDEVTIVDFGSCKFGDQKFTTYNEGRFYRAPEVLLHLPYNSAMDIWALACTAFELATGCVLFRGDSRQDQLIRIMEVLGVPPQKMISSSDVQNVYFAHGRPKYYSFIGSDRTSLFISNSPSGRRRMLPGWKRVFERLTISHPDFVDFLKRCLKWNPRERMTTQQALNHRWIFNKTLLLKNFKSKKFAFPAIRLRISKSSHAALNQTLRHKPLQSYKRPPQQTNSYVRLSNTCSLMSIKEASSFEYGRWSLSCSKHLRQLIK